MVSGGGIVKGVAAMIPVVQHVLSLEGTALGKGPAHVAQAVLLRCMDRGGRLLVMLLSLAWR